MKHNLKVLRLPTMLSEYAQLSHEAAEADEGYEQYLLRLTELEVAQRSANALAARIKAATFPVLKDLDTYDFSAMPSLSKQKILELKPGRVDRAALQCLLHRQCGHGKNALIHCSGSGGLPLRQAGAVLHRSRPG
ncbi:MAG: ATP-binding protein [Bacillota bacterium]